MLSTFIYIDWLAQSLHCNCHLNISFYLLILFYLIITPVFTQSRPSITTTFTTGALPTPTQSSSAHKQSLLLAKMLAARAARPKLALALPTSSSGSLALKTPHPRTPISPSPISPTVRNTRLNQRGFATLQQPTFAYAQCADTKSILKKGRSSTSATGKKLQFNEEPAVRCITPVPEDYHGTYVKMTRDERRWGKGSRE